MLSRSAFDGGARLWNAETGECLHVISDHTRATYSITFSPDGKYLVTGSGDGWLYVYDVEVCDLLKNIRATLILLCIDKAESMVLVCGYQQTRYL